MEYTCPWVKRMFRIAEGEAMFTATEFDAFMSHHADMPCPDCSRIDPEEGPLGVSEQDYARWEKAWKRIVVEGVPGALDAEIAQPVSI